MAYQMLDKRETLNLSVRQFALPIQRRGHLDGYSGFDWGQAQMGTDIHSKIAARHMKMEQGFQKEICLAGEFFVAPYAVKVSGRADGVFAANDNVIIEEIKSTANIEKLRENLQSYADHPYLLQAQVYGYLYYLQFAVWPTCRLRMVSSLDFKEEIFAIDFQKDVFEAWLAQKLSALKREMQADIALRAWRSVVSDKLSFPYTQFRAGQKELLKVVKGIFTSGRQGLLQAPTGLGKTMGMMLPALQDALARGKQLFYLTPKNSQHGLAEKTLKDINRKNFPADDAKLLRAVSLTAKKKICMQEEPLCDPKLCDYAKNYYDKVAEHDILAKLRDFEILNRDVFREFATKFNVCPFQLSLEAAQDAEVIIGDYNYVFSPSAALLHLLLDEDGESLKQNLLIDECHQLFQRGCDYFSPELSQKYLSDLLAEASRLPVKTRRAYKKIIKEMIAAIHWHAPGVDQPPAQRSLIKLDGEVFDILQARLQKLAYEYFQEIEKIEAHDPVVALASYLGQFCEAQLQDKKDFFVTYRKFSQGDSIKITCCTAAKHLEKGLKWFHAAVGFSATLKPFNYYAKLSGFSSEPEFCHTQEFASPFPQEHRKIMVIPQVSTKLRSRGRYIPKIAEAIERIIRMRPGNYFVFFPSYEFLDQTANALTLPEFCLRVQRPAMVKSEIDEILYQFHHDTTGKNFVLLGVQGGVFAEGIDCPGDALIGVIIVGPGLPQFELEREELKKYYAQHYGGQAQGFAYAYVYPAMTKVIQAAGRVIRTESDRGLIVLMDNRFCESEYASLMPSDWYEKSVYELVSKKILTDVENFWAAGEKRLCLP